MKVSKRTGKTANLAIPEWDSGSDPEHDEEKRHKVLILLPLPYPYLTYHWGTTVKQDVLANIPIMLLLVNHIQL